MNIMSAGFTDYESRCNVLEQIMTCHPRDSAGCRMIILITIQMDSNKELELSSGMQNRTPKSKTFSETEGIAIILVSY